MRGCCRMDVLAAPCGLPSFSRTSSNAIKKTPTPPPAEIRRKAVKRYSTQKMPILRRFWGANKAMLVFIGKKL